MFPVFLNPYLSSTFKHNTQSLTRETIMTSSTYHRGNVCRGLVIQVMEKVMVRCGWFQKWPEIFSLPFRNGVYFFTYWVEAGLVTCFGKKQRCVSSKLGPQEVFPISLLFLGTSCQLNISGLGCWMMRGIWTHHCPRRQPASSQSGAPCWFGLSVPSQDRRKNCPPDPSLNCYLMLCELQIMVVVLAITFFFF